MTKRSTFSESSSGEPTHPTGRDDEPSYSSYGGDGGDEEAGVMNKDDAASTVSGGNEESTSATSVMNAEKAKIAQRETRHVLLLRLLVCFVLLLAAVGVSLVVFFITSQSEQDQFEAQFVGAAAKVTDVFTDIATEKIGAAGALVVAWVANGIDNGGNWPFVTLSSFQRRANTAKEQSGALYIGFSPIVKRDQREAWENYTQNHPDALAYYQSSIDYQTKLGYDKLDNRVQVETDDPDLDVSTGVATHIYSLARFLGAKAEISSNKDQYLPAWQMSPMSHKRTMINEDRSTNSEGLRNCLLHDAVVFEGLQWSRPGYGDDEEPYTSEIAWLLQMGNRAPTMYRGDLFSTVYLPVYSAFEGDRDVVGAVRLVIHWAKYFENILPASMRGVVLVLENSCSEPFTYVINGPEIEPIGLGDLHDPRYDHLGAYADFTNVSNINDGTETGMRLFQDACPISIRVYPSEGLESDFSTNTPAIITFAVACIFVFAMLMFFFYDRLVERRQRLVLRKAEQTHAIVSSLFPKNVRDRIMEESQAASKKASNAQNTWKTDKGDLASSIKAGAPIADLFPECTVMFCDISGFTAWSSSRDPTQVFTLLQNIYQAFDKIAHRRKVFKVETIGDSYVAVTGLPEPQAHHAIIMVRFATECMSVMRTTVRNLETTLGPDTGDLSMRFGLHSGPVTAGVLMGDRARFQLFGDTVNTASRMESTGVRNKIQVSQATADLLIGAGKQHWATPREDEVHAKGKGRVKTFWVAVSKHAGTSQTSSDSGGDVETGVYSSPFDIQRGLSDKNERLVNWMTELFKSYIQEILARRMAVPPKGKTAWSNREFQRREGTPLDEVVEVIELPEFDAKAAAALGQKGRDIEISPQIIALLREFICMIASKYHDNPFHNFEHACHVTLSTDKFLKRIVAPDIESSVLKGGLADGALKVKATELASQLHDYTHGINSDPIASFAIVFSALVHDVDHRGVSNAQLAIEQIALGSKYSNKSIAEQNSLDLAWSLMMSDKFEELRRFVFATSEELARFRQVIVNVVLATDIFDKELNDLRKKRWNKAFSDEALSTVEKNGLRATIVIEHIIQASDVSHTMQHWHIYTKWNKRLFQEMTVAHRAGRMAVDPASFWFKGEIGFFDNYVIPLAKKLKDCKVFGVNSDQCLVYAQKNREEWEEKGQEIVAGMVEEFKDL